MKWRKLGRVYAPDGRFPWAAHHAFPPTPYLRDGDTLRLFMACCDSDNVGRIGYVDVSAHDPRLLLRVSEQPVLDIGTPGAFDESGVLPTSVVQVGDELFMYYVGYQLGTKVKYLQFQGLAVSSDGGDSFRRARRVPVLDRSQTELLSRTSAFVAREDGVFRAWYVGGSESTMVDDGALPAYSVRYLESRDGIHWGPTGRECLDLQNEDEHAFGRPWIIDLGGARHMFYSVRTRSKDYRIGVARADENGGWVRHDDEVGIDVSPDGWDSEMVAYASVVTLGTGTFMFYNGNDRGGTGFGCAVLASL